MTGTPTAAIWDFVDQKTYYFKGTKFWSYDEKTKEFDVVRKEVTTRFDGIPNNISGGFVDIETSEYNIK